jgi:hypothetical protein
LRNIILPTLLLIVVSAFRRYSSGVDVMNYYESYKYEMFTYGFNDIIKKFEPGWYLINIFVKNNLGDFRWIIILSSILSIAPIYFFYKRTSKLPILSLLLYFILFYYFYSFSLIRQAIATSFFLISFYFYGERRFYKSAVYIFIAAMFHYSALALIPLILILDWIKISHKLKIYILVGSFIIGASGILDSAANLLVYLPFEKYANYADFYGEVEFNRIANYLFLLPRTLICLYFFKIFEHNNSYKMNLTLTVFWMGVVLGNLFTKIPLFTRFILFFTILETILLVALIYEFPKSKRKIQSVIVLCYASLYFIYFVITNRYGAL